jgi:MFS family permease
VLGGVVVAVGGVRAGLAVDAATFLLSLPLLARVPRLRPAPRDHATTVLADAREGLRYTLRTRAIRALVGGFFLAGLAAGDDVALPFLAGDLGAGARGTGALYAAAGAGLLLGFAGLARGRRHAAPKLVVGATVAALGNTLTGVAPFIVAAVGFQVVRGVGLALYDTMLQTTLQREVPRPLLGRVMANAFGAVNVAACAGLLVGGPLLDATSARTLLLACGGLGLLSAGVSARAGRMSP